MEHALGTTLCDPSAPSIDAELLLQALRSGWRVTVVDVRPIDEFRGPSGWIDGARWIPIHQLSGRMIELSTHRAELVVVVSRRGHTSQLAARMLAERGFAEPRSLAGGMARWLELGYPVRRSSGVSH
jgi:rhodanese-related sulfurtransferase